MPNMSGKGKTKYEFSNDQLFENGKPMKNEAGLQAKPVEENTILINGRGQVLTSGNPDKKILKCVENRVEKEKSYADGWEDKIMSECQSKK